MVSHYKQSLHLGRRVIQGVTICQRLHVPVETASGDAVRHGVREVERQEWKPQHRKVVQPGCGWPAQNVRFFAVWLLGGAGEGGGRKGPYGEQ